MDQVISCPNRNIEEGSSASNNESNNYYICNTKNRVRVDKFKGLVPQQNGHWGAQIYSNHQRIWLGTFKSEIEAAMAYDSATISLRGVDSHRNFPWTNITIQEPKFQSNFTTEAVLNMIRDGSYPSKFSDYLRCQKGEIDIGINLSAVHGNGGEFSCTLLFQKELTPSDVGKLNRLVIPKRFAVKHFPNVPDPKRHNGLHGDLRVDEVQLEFYDRFMYLWKFRYCYWKSSQSFVFTRGWNGFVKKKGLRAFDTIAFYLYESREVGRCFRKSFLVIDVDTKEDFYTNDGFDERDVNLEGIKEKKKVDHLASDPLASNDSKVGFRLFGVQID